MITEMKAMVIDREHPNPIKKEEPKEKEAKKYFYPKLLIASGWSKDVMDVSLCKLHVVHSSRMQCIVY